MTTRKETDYKGVFYREAKRLGKNTGSEKVYYAVFWKDGEWIEEKVGRQFADNMTSAKANRIRGDLIEGRRPLRREIRKRKKEKGTAAESRWTFDKLFREYVKGRPDNKARSVDANRYENYLQPYFGKKEPMELAPLDVERLRIKLLKKLAPQTVKHIINLLTWIANFGVKQNLCEEIPFHIKKPTVDNTTTEDLSPDQLARLLDAIEADSNIDAVNIMKLALFSGMRRGE